MKKMKKIFGGIFLAALFIGALVLFLRPYLAKDHEEETNKQLSVEPPKQLYELGEDMNINGLAWNVSEAELIEDYDKIDSYYKEREYLQRKEDYVKGWVNDCMDRDLFIGDIQFFRMKCSITNTDDETHSFEYSSLLPTSIIGAEMVRWYFDNYDVKILSSSGKEPFHMEGYQKPEPGETIKTVSYKIQPKESIQLEIIGQFNLCDIYHIYNDNQDTGYELFLLGQNSTKRIRLNISGNFEGNKRYAEARKMQEMKSQSWTNLELMAWEKEWNEKLSWEHGYQLDKETKPIVETEDAGQEFFDELNGFAILTTLNDFQIFDWKDMPSDFAEQGNLQKMAKRYHDIYNCNEEELKVLVLDLKYASSEQGEISMDYYKKRTNYFYGRSKIYVKDANNELWMFGTADSWIVTENSAHPENTGSVNLDQMELDESISIRMAYILPPQLYEQYSALYFTGGADEVTFSEEYIPITKIALK